MRHVRRKTNPPRQVRKARSAARAKPATTRTRADGATNRSPPIVTGGLCFLVSRGDLSGQRRAERLECFENQKLAQEALEQRQGQRPPELRQMRPPQMTLLDDVIGEAGEIAFEAAGRGAWRRDRARGTEPAPPRKEPRLPVGCVEVRR